MEYNFSSIEEKWQQSWKANGTYKVKNESDKPPFYVLDMFPYPSGAGLHVGHPLGYIASDIYSRFKRLQGFNVLHPMGFDSFGLPAEQYALETGQHPADTTEKNIATFKKQLDKIGFCYDWDREVRTSDPQYYRWTQWIFLQLFNSWYDVAEQKAKPIQTLMDRFEQMGGTADLKHIKEPFTAEEWKGFSLEKKEEVLMDFRLAFSAFGEVNWCEALGTVLANDEVINGVSERGGHPVIKKKMRQWYLRITDYADRLLAGLDTVDFSDSMKEMQRNWIGRSEGCEVDFKVDEVFIKVYTTRPDTIFGTDFLVLAPEHELVSVITTASHQKAVEEYLHYVKSRSDRERMADTKHITGCFTGAYVTHPITGKQLPVWIAEYVLSGYGTGAIMAVPCGDQRDFLFAKHFHLPITNIIGDHFNGIEANHSKDIRLSQSDFLNDKTMREAMPMAIEHLEALGCGKRKVNYKMRDAGFSRQRYWGEPFPVKWINGVAVAESADSLPLELPHVGQYGPGPEGEGPLANIIDWKEQSWETSTMPGYAGSSWYFLRYMDPKNQDAFCSRSASDYWGQVNVYIGGTEHAVGHLLYSRMWTKVLYDLGHIGFDEPFKKLVNQGMIQGSSRFVYRVKGTNQFVSYGLISQYDTDRLHVDVSLVDGFELDMDAFRKWKPDYAQAVFILEDDGKYICGSEVEKMSKSKFNTVNPDDLVLKYGADTFRMYEMFLGPLDQSKPWDTKGIEGVHRFLKKLWRLFFDEIKGVVWNTETPVDAELKVLHRTIKKITADTEHFHFNTAVSAFMVAVNELTDLHCYKKEILEQLLILLAPYAPHITEELWHVIGHQNSILDAPLPMVNEQYLTESSKDYPVSINGKLRTNITIDLNADAATVEKIVLANETVQKWTGGLPPKKVIFVKGKMVNIVI